MTARIGVFPNTVPPVWRIMPAARTVAAGGVIAYPTEAVYGLGCLPTDWPIRRLLHIKQRSPQKGLILVAASIEQLLSFVVFPDEASRRQVQATWPGPVTWLLPARRGVSSWLTGSHTTLAVRVSAHPLVKTLCHYTGPLVSTSANRAGAEPVRDAARLRAGLGRSLDYVLVGRVGDSRRPTAIRDATTGALIRAGG